MQKFPIQNILGVLTVLTLAGLADGARAASLFLDSWGVSYGGWTPLSAPSNTNWVVEDWTGGNGGFLDPGWGGDDYDAEAAFIALDSQYLYLAVVTGFPLTGRDFYSDHYAAGDLFIDAGADGSYEHAVDVDAGGALRSGLLSVENPTSFGSPAFGGVSDPLRTTSWLESDAAAGFNYGDWNGRYAIEAKIDRGLLAAGDSYKLHWTMGCGNDEIEVELQNPVPEPGSFLLLGMGVGVAGLFAGRRRKQAQS